ncbi:hypothetical protein PsAD2_00215 [Pseudovibrio axinellae]|uniref:SGNH hydrolase-type esterase domain-containing protein n=1 Tax=Pseudovibrio axinellae TaxID=989403 RepID=A0A166B0P7_9HYPH|nr:hypothetical protein [Pseudovibrio axinellae]KZL21794.1 hypothetical protein PsAD2_00215 [Pseudovibrio axinellae]SEQ78808.1 N-acetylmuramoyl-L-alanine amidase [Pseudovibrio axinellae]
MKITYDEFLNIARDPNVSEQELLKYCDVVEHTGAFDIHFRVKPDMVEMTGVDEEFESALQIGNWASRIRRYWRFKEALKDHPDRPMLISEGDSWFQFPILIDDVVDHLSAHYNIYSLGAAGDTAQNMVFGANRARRREYLSGLKSYKDQVSGFLFSAAGNDIIGEDPDTGVAALYSILKDFNGDIQDVAGHIDRPAFDEKLRFLKEAYGRVLSDIRGIDELRNMPVFVHGYDYVFPYKWEGDTRSPLHAAKDEWLGEPLSERNIPSVLGRKIISKMLDELYEMLQGLAARDDNVIVVDCRGAMANLSDWIDEIHGTSAGFAKVAGRFKTAIDRALVAQGALT